MYHNDLGQFASKGNNKEKHKVPLSVLLGEEYTGYKGQEAINKVYKEQKGYVKDAFYRDVIGGITIFWGDGSCGLSHILERRNNQKVDADYLLKTIGKVIEKGDISIDKQEPSRWIISYNNKRAIIATELRDEEIICLFNGFFA